MVDLNNLKKTLAARAALELRDDQISQLLGEDINNVIMFSAYDLANRNAGWILGKNGYMMQNRHENRILFQEMRRVLERDAAFGGRKLVLGAVKTVARADYPGWHQFTANPAYKESEYVVGNIISYDATTQSFVAHDRGWTGVGAYGRLCDAAANGMHDFALYVSRFAQFRNPFLGR